MKKITSLLLVVMIVLSLPACGGNDSTTDNDNGSSSNQTQTNVTDSSSAEQNADSPTSTTSNIGDSDSTDVPSSTTSKPATTTKPETSKPATTTKPETSKPTTTTKPETSKPTTTTKPETSKPATTTKPETTKPSTPTHTHSYSDATCTAPAKCSCGATSGSALGHKEVVDNAVSATCTETGLTEGKHCSICNTVIVKQKTVDKLPHNYSEKYISENPSHILFTCEKCGDNYKENIAPITAKISTGIGTMLVNGVRYDTCIYIEDITGGYGAKKIVSSAGYKSFTTDFDFENGQLVSKTVDVIYLQSGALLSRTVNISISDSYGNTKTYQVQI